MILRKDSKIQYLGNDKDNEKGDVFYIDTKHENIKTISVNENGKLEWNKVSALTKHLPINTDGSNDLIKITTMSGKTLTATKAKSFLTLIVHY